MSCAHVSILMRLSMGWIVTTAASNLCVSITNCLAPCSTASQPGLAEGVFCASAWCQTVPSKAVAQPRAIRRVFLPVLNVRHSICKMVSKSVKVLTFLASAPYPMQFRCQPFFNLLSAK
ncbi:MAG: hypothetical protein EB110_06365 [Betaproteobacteria bacterium]|nr:hypothetical protein [Betaproteobacteria bacterium]